jgi:hypothetical protein
MTDIPARAGVTGLRYIEDVGASDMPEHCSAASECVCSEQILSGTVIGAMLTEELSDLGVMYLLDQLVIASDWEEAPEISSGLAAHAELVAWWCAALAFMPLPRWPNRHDLLQAAYVVAIEWSQFNRLAQLVHMGFTPSQELVERGAAALSRNGRSYYVAMSRRARARSRAS